MTPSEHPAHPPLRLLFVDHVGQLGGGELSLLDLARHHRAHGAVVLFEDGPFRERLEAEGVAVHVWPAPAAVSAVTREGGSGARAVPGVARLALRLARLARRFDVLYANSQKALVVAAVAGALARRPVVWHLRDLLTEEHFSPSRLRLATTLANRGTRLVIANSEATAAAFRARGGRPDRVSVVYNGLDPAPFDAVSEADAAAVRAEFGLGAAPLVGVFSRLAPWKGQHVLLEALRTLPGVQALLVGDALFQDEQAYRAALVAQAERLGLADRVRFAGFRSDVARLMRAVDVVAHTSAAAEPFGRVIVEGLLARRPVVATAAGGALEILRDGETGLLVPPGDAAALAAAVRRLIAEPALAARLATAGRADAEARFSVVAMARGVDAAVRAVRSRP